VGPVGALHQRAEHLCEHPSKKLVRHPPAAACHPFPQVPAPCPPGAQPQSHNSRSSLG
jgi:hypothetical protein